METLQRAGPAGPDARWFAVVMHTAFFLLLGASLARFLLRHPGEPITPWVLGLSIALAALYVLGPALGVPASQDAQLRQTTSGAARPGGTAPARQGGTAPAQPGVTAPALLWLAGIVAVWVVLVVLAPSFAWCAVPLLYTGLRLLPLWAAVALAALLTAFIVAAQWRLSAPSDPTLLFIPPAVAAIAVAVFVHMQRQAARQRGLIDALIRTRRELAATERREGALAERERLARDIHDTVAQGLSSQRMLLQAAERTWDTDPARARDHVRAAAEVAEHGLAEARRFVHDLAPADLASGGGLGAALRILAERESGTGLTVRCEADEAAEGLPDLAQAALLRIAQGALANVREHAGATTAAITLTHLGDRVVLDIGDDGHGFPATPPEDRAPDERRGYGIAAMRARIRRLGGRLTVESVPGEGTVVSAVLPLTTAPARQGAERQEGDEEP